MKVSVRNIITIAALLILTNILAAQSGQWEEIGTMKYPLANGYVFFNGSNTDPKFFFIGGFLGVPKKNSDWIQEYRIQTGEWSIMPFFMNTPRVSFTAGVSDSTIVYFGGAQDNSNAKDALESWNFVKATSPVIIARNSNFDRKYANGFVRNNELIIVGGKYTNVQDTIFSVFRYDLAANTPVYKENNSILSNTSDNMSFLSADNVFLIGGVYGGFIKKFINTYSISPKSFSARSETLTKPKAGGAAVLDIDSNTAYVIGGYDEVNKALTTVEEIKINIDGSLSIRSLANLKYGRKYPMVSMYNSILYVFGGYDETDNVVDKIERFGLTVTSGENNDQLPKGFILYQNYPNPFNPTTGIKFDLPLESNVNITVYNLLGEAVTTLINKVVQAGSHIVEFDAGKLTSGVYVYRLKTDNFVQLKKMLLMK